jgi:hypothetical protein
MWRILYPLRYFSLVNSEKRNIDFLPTLLLAIILSFPFIFVEDSSFFRPNGFLDKLLTLTAALTGFYVAALVAAATFSHPNLDKVIKVGPVALITKDADGHKVAEALTRREFVCTIFGYLAFSAFAISIVAALLIGISGAQATFAHWKWIGVAFSSEYWRITRGVVIFLVTLSIAHLATVTALGIYYLMDRLYRRDRQITTLKPDDGDDHRAAV